VIGGKINVPGGRQASGEVTNVLEVYDPRQDVWTQSAPLPTALSGYALVAFEGRLYLFGGWDGEKYLASVYEYDPGQDTWDAGLAMPTPRGYLGAAVSGRKIFVLGGYDGESALSINEIFLPDLIGSSSTPWQSGEPLPEAKYAMGVTSVADLIYVIGGKGSPNSQYAFLVYLDPSAEWQSIEAEAGLVRSGLGLTSLGVTLYAVGGSEGDVPTQSNLAYQAIFTLSFPIIIK